MNALTLDSSGYLESGVITALNKYCDDIHSIFLIQISKIHITGERYGIILSLILQYLCACY